MARAERAVSLRRPRDNGHFRPLDYGPLDAVLERYPEPEAATAHELQPGLGYCWITPDEAPAARTGFASRFALIRSHAQAVLEEAQDTLR